MAIVKFLPSQKSTEVELDTTLFDAAIKAGLPVASSCSADSVCGKCNMQVISGSANLSRQAEIELKLLQREKKPLTDRISCMVRVKGDCTVTTTYW